MRTKWVPFLYTMTNDKLLSTWCTAEESMDSSKWDTVLYIARLFFHLWSDRWQTISPVTNKCHKHAMSYYSQHKHTYSHHFNGQFPGKPGLASCLIEYQSPLIHNQNCSSILFEVGRWGWPQAILYTLTLTVIQICYEVEVFLMGQMPFISANQQCQSTERQTTIHKILKITHTYWQSYQTYQKCLTVVTERSSAI